ncbi:hypothetical protein [Duganella violaceipulchra]|uniref:Cobalt transporter n=1 Tax=Duganella violaceipulchra TaxID=2849652 RepID=A0AA41HBY3_9BURK|nr:hypothetical protein [Duganella violaceicalia]MBV6323761.1 hypothetical protein [Duganella violaceicalia]MCP2007451.1 hypothetical protein [Duganella violaceicalia]
MKNALLILLMLVLPLQAIAAAERNLTHVLGSGSGQGLAFIAQHMAEHAEHVLHHHDDDDDADDGGIHVDSSHKSIQHLADYEQGCGMNILLSAFDEPCLPVTPRVVPIFRSDGFSDRTTIPLLRPPRALA